MSDPVQKAVGLHHSPHFVPEKVPFPKSSHQDVVFNQLPSYRCNSFLMLLARLRSMAGGLWLTRQQINWNFII